MLGLSDWVPRIQGMRKQIFRLYGADLKYDKNRGDTNGEQCNKSSRRFDNENLRLKRGKRVDWRYNGYVRYRINN